MCALYFYTDYPYAWNIYTNWNMEYQNLCIEHNYVHILVQHIIWIDEYMVDNDQSFYLRYNCDQ